MSKERKDNKVYLLDIKRSCSKILKYTKNKTENEFTKDHLLSDAVEKNLLVIGEAATKISTDFKKENPQIDWKSIVGIRNKIIHEYFDINIDTIWLTVTEDIPVLKKQVTKILKNLSIKKLK